MDAITKSFNSEALNIGLVTETYPPEVNGVAMTLSRLVDGLAQHKHRITLYRPKPLHGLTSTTASHEQVFLPGLPIPGYSEMHFGLPAGRFFTKYWHAHRTDILYVATEGPLGASAIRAARRLGIPVISGFHTNFHTYSRYYQFGRLSPLIFRYLRRLHNSTDMSLVPTRMLAEKLKGQGFDRVNVMQRGVDTTLFTPDRRCGNLGQLWQADNDTLVCLYVCLYVGRIAAEKNIGQAIETYEALKTH